MDSIIWASTCEFLERVKLLIKLGVDIQAQDNKAIIWASWGGYLEIVQLLIKFGANVQAQDNQGETMMQLFLLRIINIKHTEVVKLLIEFGACIPTNDIRINC